MFRALMILALVLAGGAARAAPRLGEAAPEVSATTFDGGQFDLARLRGHVVVINFWATWCPPCRAEMPALDAAYARLHGQGLEMIGLSADKPRDEDKARKAMAGFGYPAAMAARAHMPGLPVPAALPETLVVDRSGALRAVINSGAPLTEDRLEAILTPIIAETANRTP